MTPRSLLLLLVASAGSMGLRADLAPVVAPRQSAPPAGVPKNFRVPEPRALALPNGLRVVLLPYGDVPKAEVQLRLDVGRAHDPAGRPWLSELTGRLMEQGSTTRSAAQVAQQMADMGGSLSVSVGTEQTSVGGEVLSEFAAPLVRLIADVARHPALPASELPRLQADLKRDLSVARSRQQAQALERFRAALYGKHPYALASPSAAQIDALTREHVRAFHAAGFVAAQATLYVAGRFDAAAVEQAARTSLGDWARGARASIAPPQPRARRVVHVLDKPGAVQTTLLLGLPVIDPSRPDYVALVVANTLLGGYSASRITANIRENKGYTYSPGSQITSHRGDAYWSEQADVTTNVTAPALREIFAEIQRLSSEAPSAEELRAVQNYLAGTFVIRNSSRGGLIEQFDFLRRHGLTRAYLDEYVTRVYAVTPAKVQQVTRTLLRADALTIVAVGDRQALGDSLAAFGPVE